MPVGSLATNHDFEALDADSYTAHRLKHASPEHLHITSRRFFIGPIPEGWLKSNRKSWYKRRLEFSTYSSRRATFTAAENQGPHHRTLTGLENASTAARMSFSFPQPEDVNDDASTTQVETEDEEDEDEDIKPRIIEPVSTEDAPRILGITDPDDSERPKLIPVPRDIGLGGGDPSRLSPLTARRPKSPTKESFVTAHEAIPESTRQSIDIREPSPERDPAESSTSNRNSLQPTMTPTDDLNDTDSRTALLGRDSLGVRPTGVKKPKSTKRSLRQHDPAPIQEDDAEGRLERTATGVRFKVSEGVQHGQYRVWERMENAKGRMANLRRNTLREGTIIKMERMLVRVDITMQQISNDFDENESLKTETRPWEKWREFMVVARKSKTNDADDFRLQAYKTRVIPEIDDEKTKKKPKYEIRLDPKTTHVNLFSSLDKTVVIWHPYKKGTRIIVMRPTSTAHSVEWYTFLRDALGWQRASTLQVNVPDLDVSLQLERPFEVLETANIGVDDEETTVAKVVAAEQAVAGKIISQCIDLLKKDSQWSEVLQKWEETTRMGLAWKRYDRLEWIHGMNEQKMYGTMAMKQTHDLELRPKYHFPTTATGKKGKVHDEPAPIEGFLIRLTSQKGAHQRFGKSFFKRLYFSTQNQFLIFSKPGKASPPAPPHLATISGSNIPTSQEIVEKSPITYDIEPFKLRGDQISWLSSGNKDFIQRHDRQALAEVQRNIANLMESDGYINMCTIVKVRKYKADRPGQEDLIEPDSGSDAESEDDIDDDEGDIGVRTHIDTDRIFELLLDNGLVIRLEAYNKKTRKEWVQRLRKLVKYWKLRTAAEMATFRSTRAANLEELKIDEEQEAILGQFGRKWEVNRSEASPELYNMCGISSCRSVAMSGLLYYKPRRHATFERCSVILSGGKMLIYQATLRQRNGKEIKHIHHEKQTVIDLKNCYVYSGLIVEDDLLYQNRTFDANHPGMASLPRVYLEDGWTSSDVDVMTCFVLWMNRRKGWFRSASTPDKTITTTTEGGARAKLRRVAQLGVPGRGMVFKCRSRAERDHWVLNVSTEIERLVEMEALEETGDNEIRLHK